MKVNKLFAILAAAAVVACAKTPTPEPGPGPEPDPQTGIVKDGDKTVFYASYAGSGTFTQVWKSSDSFVVNGVFASDISADAEGKEITYKALNVNKPFCMISPATLFNTEAGAGYNAEAKRITIIVPGSGEKQEYAADSYSASSAIVAAYSNVSKVTAKGLSTIMKLVVSGGTDSDNIREVRIFQGDGSFIAGAWDVLFTSEDDIKLSPWELTTPIDYWCGAAGVPQGTEMNIVLPAYNFDKGLIVSIQDVNDHFRAYSIPASSSDFSGKAGVAVHADIEFSPKGTFNIASKEDWENMALQINGVAAKAPCDINIMADINTDNLTRISKSLIGNIEGNNHTITRTAGMNNLFRSIKGNVQNLNFAGEMNGEFHRISSLADTLHAPGLIKNVTSSMKITSTKSYVGDGYNYIQIGGIICILNGGTVENCSNSGDLTANLDFSPGKMNMSIGGVVNQIAAKAEPVLIKNCSNSGKLTAALTSSNSSSYVEYNSIGGIVGWVRCNANPATIEGCTNSGAICFDSKGVTDAQYAVAARVSCAGGIAGLCTPLSSSNIATNATDANGICLNIENCTNTADIRNNNIHYTATGALTNKIFTAGIAGSLFGKPGSYSKIKNCTNTGNLYPYDITSDNPEYFASMRAPYCHVTGGLVGFGGYIDIEGCKVNCIIGNGKRPSYAFGGLMGIAYRQFNVKDTGVWVTGKWARIDGVKDNISSIGNAMKTYNSTALNVTVDIAGSTISNCKVGGNVLTGLVDAENLGDVSASCTEAETFGSEDKTVSGQGYTSRSSDVTISGMTYIKSASEL